MKLLQRMLAGMLCITVGVSHACTLRVAERARPTTVASPQGSPAQGLEAGILQALAQKAGCRLQTQSVSLRGAWMAMERGHVDVMAGALRTSERERIAEIVPLLATSTVLLTPKGQSPATTPAEVMAQTQTRVLRLQGAAYSPAIEAWLKDLDAQGRVDAVSDYKAAFRLLAAGRAAAFPISAAMLPPSGDALLQSVQVIDAWPQERVWAGVALSRQTLSEPQRQHLRRAIATLLRDGTIQALLNHHHGEPSAHRMRVAPAENLAPAASR